MPTNVLDYKGDAALGGGGDVPVVGTPNLDVINGTMRDIMLLDNQRNMDIFHQKVKDRDKLNDMIDTDQVSVGEIMPEYQPFYDTAKKRVEDVFSKWRGNFNDTKGFNEYKAAVQDLKDVAKHGQVNTAELKKMQQSIATEQLPQKKQDMQRWYDKQLKSGNFWKPVTPYQQLHDFSSDDILKLAQPITKKVQDPDDPFSTYDETYFDYQDILRTAQNTYLNNQEAADSINQFVTKLEEQTDPAQLALTIDSINAQLESYNQQRGLQQGMKGFVEPIKTVPQGGRLRINEPRMTLAAKWALASQDAFTTKTPKFNKDLAKFAIDKEKVAIQAKKLGVEAGKAGAYIRNLDAKTNKFVKDQQAAGTNVVKQYEDFVNAYKPNGLNIGKAGGAGNTDVVYMDQLPGGYQFINGPVIATDAKGKPTAKVTVGKLEPFTTTGREKRPYYITKYLNSANGDSITPKSDFIQQTFKTWRTSGYAGSIDDMMKTLLKNGALELVLQGKNGAANYTSIYQSAKTMNAAATTKGEENVVNAPASYPEEAEQPEPQENP